MLCQIACKQHSGLHALFLHIPDHLIPLHAFPARNQETEPAGPGMRAGFRKNQLFLCSLKSCLQAVEIVTAPLHKGWEFIQLGASNGGLHVRCLQVISEMGIHVFVVIPQRKLPELSVKPVSAHIVAA